MMKIYKFEEKAGLTDKITTNSKASCACSLINDKIDNGKALAAKFYNNDEYVEYEKKYLDKDIMLMHGILVSTNWNQNDDVFTADHTWSARSTPRFKPANLEHMGSEQSENKILGCIVNAYTVDSEMNHYYPEKEVPAEGDNFDIVVSIVVWEKYFPSTCEMIKDKMGKGEMGLSMECLFTDFGYALKRDKEVMLLDRNEITAWLTSSLRVYGGSGIVDIDGKTYKIGRWLKNFTYSGVGFVENPANVRSILFEDYISHASIRKISDVNFNVNSKNGVLNSRTGLSLWVLK